MGFSGLEQLQQHVAAELRANPSLAGRLAETISRIDGTGASALDVTLRIHLDCLNQLRHDISSDAFLSAVRQIINAGRVAVFGIGPSSSYHPNRMGGAMQIVHSRRRFLSQIGATGVAGLGGVGAAGLSGMACDWNPKVHRVLCFGASHCKFAFEFAR